MMNFGKDESNNGFTLVELIIVLLILGILSLIVVSRCLAVTENTRRDICEANRLELEHI